MKHVLHRSTDSDIKRHIVIFALCVFDVIHQLDKSVDFQSAMTEMAIGVEKWIDNILYTVYTKRTKTFGHGIFEGYYKEALVSVKYVGLYILLNYGLL